MTGMGSKGKKMPVQTARDAIWWDDVRACLVDWFKTRHQWSHSDFNPGYEFVIFEDGDYGVGLPMTWPFAISFRHRIDDADLDRYESSEHFADDMLRRAGYSEN